MFMVYAEAYVACFIDSFFLLHVIEMSPNMAMQSIHVHMCVRVFGCMNECISVCAHTWCL